jgi:hypothetical protein
MPGRPRKFVCPNCNSLYELVKVEAGPETVHREVACRSCEEPLPGIEGNFVLKYFLLRKGLVGCGGAINVGRRRQVSRGAEGATNEAATAAMVVAE